MDDNTKKLQSWLQISACGWRCPGQAAYQRFLFWFIFSFIVGLQCTWWQGNVPPPPLMPIWLTAAFIRSAVLTHSVWFLPIWISNSLDIGWISGLRKFSQVKSVSNLHMIITAWILRRARETEAHWWQRCRDVSLEMVRMGTERVCVGTSPLPASPSRGLSFFFSHKKILVIELCSHLIKDTKTFTWLFREGWRKLFAPSQPLNTPTNSISVSRVRRHRLEEITQTSS